MIDLPAAALDAATAARVTLVIGVVDAGKTTLVTRLAAALASPGDLVGVVDADLGQSDIGPPTTVGLGLVHGAIDRLDQAEVVAEFFELGLDFDLPGSLGFLPFGSAFALSFERGSPPTGRGRRCVLAFCGGEH